MSIAVPSWAQADVSSIRANRTLGPGAQRQPLGPEQAAQMDQMISVGMDQLVAIDEKPGLDLAMGQPGVVRQPLPEMPNMPGMPVIDPPTTRFEGDKQNGSSVSEMDNPMLPMCTVTDYSADSVSTIVCLGGMMPGQQLVHIDRKNPANSFVEVKGEVWNMMGNAMAQMGMGNGLPGMPG